MKIKYFLLLFTLFFAQFTQAQSEQVLLDWEKTVYQVSGTQPQEIFAVKNYPITFFPESGNLEVKIPVVSSYPINENNFKISDIKTKRIQPYEFKGMKFNHVKNEISYDIVSGKDEKGVKNVLIINPFIKKGNDIHQILSFNYTIQQKYSPKSQNLAAQQATNSVLATGNWYKIKINESGIYKIDKNLLTQLGVPADVNPKTIKVYGYGGKMLPLKNADNQYFDLPELAIYAYGENDGVLNDNDYFYFYGEGTRGWDDRYGTHINLYSDEAYYYITFGGSYGKRIQTYQQPALEQNPIELTTTDARLYYEEDLNNLAHVGARWVGSDFSTSFIKKFNFKLQNLAPNTIAKFTGRLASVSSSDTQYDISLNNTSIVNLALSGVNSDFGEAYEKSFAYSVNNPLVDNTLQVTFDNKGVPSARGYVDFVAVDYKKMLKGYGKQFEIKNKTIANAPNVIKYKITSAQQISQVWNVTDSKNPTLILNNQNTLSFSSTLSDVYVALDAADVYKPIAVGALPNQNLKQEIFAQGPVDYLIITQPALVSQAQRLANFYETKHNLNTKIVTVDRIYNEFSGGQKDIVAIRNFVRYVYINTPDPNRKLKYLNLFGETSFDPKNRVENNTDVVPTFHILYNENQPGYFPSSNYSEQRAFSTDDFFVLLDPEEGDIRNQNYLGLDVAVGRMLVTDINEAKTQVDKVLTYHKKENIGDWKISGIALADDVDSASDRVFAEQLNNSTDDLVAEKPYFNVKKIFLDAYTQEITSGGPRYPQAKQDLYNSINSGALFVNYLGHGGYNGLSAERIMDLADVENLSNTTRFPLFVIVTCEFTKYDDPTFLSGGERLLKKIDGGAIALIATSRKISVSNGRSFTERVNNYLFNINNLSGDNLSVAEVLRQVKNSGPSEKGVVSYLGDPALKLSVPKTNIALTKINDIAVNQFNGHLRALDLVKIEGVIQDENGQFLPDFNGAIAIKVFDKPVEKTTLANDKVKVGGVLYKMKFSTLGEVVFKGNATVSNGKFKLEFMIPKDIRQDIGAGKFSFYAQRDTEFLDDYTGANLSIKIGGYNTNAAEDNTPPDVWLYMNDESFVNGGITTSSPLFLAKIEDQNGINTASGIGHDIVAILDENTANPIVLNDFFETELNNFRKGYVKYPFSNLEKGKHTITFKVWDSYNNMTQKQIEFFVNDQQGVVLEHVLNYPNPFIDYTEFWFQHNKPNQALQVQVQIFTVSGRLVKTINKVITDSALNVRDITWDGKDDFGNVIAKGVYVYKLKVKSLLTGEIAEKIEKIVKL